MRYMMLIYTQENAAERMSHEEVEGVKATHWAVMQEAREKGIFQGAEPLKSTATATTVRVQGGKAFTTDGPFAETKEQLGGFTLIDVRDLNEAIALAECSPLARIGSIEVRPVGHPGWPESTA
jgi:hypothetical protein